MPNVFPRVIGGSNIPGVLVGAGPVDTVNHLIMSYSGTSGEWLGMSILVNPTTLALWAAVKVSITIDSYNIFNDYLYSWLAAFPYYQSYGLFTTSDIVNTTSPVESFCFEIPFDNSFSFDFWNTIAGNSTAFINMFYRTAG